MRGRSTLGIQFKARRFDKLTIRPDPSRRDSRTPLYADHAMTVLRRIPMPLTSTSTNIAKFHVAWRFAARADAGGGAGGDEVARKKAIPA